MTKFVSRITEDDMVAMVSTLIREYIADAKSRLVNPNDAIDISEEGFNNFMLTYDKEDFVERVLRERMDEGLIKTYDAESVIRIGSMELGIPAYDMRIERYYDKDLDSTVETVNVMVPTTTTVNKVGEITHFMKRCGYHLSRPTPYKTKTENGVMLIYPYEPTFSKDVSEEVFEKYEVLFHATPLAVVPKIFDNGLVPRSKNRLFLYPDRVYCMKGNNLTDEQIFILKNVQHARSLKPGLHDNNKYVILKINVSKLPKDMRFYVDPNAPDAVFTHDNIPPEAIMIDSEL